MEFNYYDKNSTEEFETYENERKAWENSKLFPQNPDGMGLWIESGTLKSYLGRADGHGMGNKSYRDDYLVGEWVEK